MPLIRQLITIAIFIILLAIVLYIVHLALGLLALPPTIVTIIWLLIILAVIVAVCRYLGFL